MMSEGSTKSYLQAALKAIVIGGLVAGTIDIVAACLINRLNPVVILQVIASGVLGRSSFRLGLTSVALGLVLQWFMSVLIAAIFVGAGRRFLILSRHWIAAGLLYGVAVFVVMNFLVVPLSAAKLPAKFTAVGFLANLAAMLLFGVIIAFFVRQKTLPAPQFERTSD